MTTRASESLLAREAELARAITDALYEARPDLLATYGAAGRTKCLQDVRYTLEHLAAAVALGEPELFVRYVTWLVELLRARAIPPGDVRASLEATEAVLATHLANEESEVAVRSIRAALATLSPGGVR